MTLSYFIVLAALGGVGGYLAGLLGIGGGMLLVPLLTMVFTWQGLPFDLLVHAAVATSMATILFTSISSTLAHHRRGAVMWSITLSMLPGLVIGGLIAGGSVFALIPAGWLALGFGLFVGYSAIGMLRSHKVAADRSLPGPVGIAAVGLGIGFASGLVGAGGGFLAVPFLSRCNVSLPRAIATSASLGFPIALANTAGYVWSGWEETAGNPTMLGYVVWPALLLIAVISVFCAPYGAAMAHRLPVHYLRRIFALLLIVLALYMCWKAYVAFAG